MWPPSSVRLSSITTSLPERSMASRSIRRLESSQLPNSSATISKSSPSASGRSRSIRCRSVRSYRPNAANCATLCACSPASVISYRAIVPSRVVVRRDQSQPGWATIRKLLPSAGEELGATAENLPMTEVQVNRWRKYGKDRLYVNAADGVRIGWLDYVSGERVLERPELREAFEAALAKAGLPACPASASSVAPPPRVAVKPPRPSGPIWVDLAQNKPGQAAREQALAQREEMRERSKVGTFLARAIDAKTDERAWRVGADGEEAVGAQL